MKKTKRKYLSHFLNVIIVALIVESFLCAMMLVNKFVRENCFDNIEKTTEQMSNVLNYSLEERRERLEMLAGILDLDSDRRAELMTYIQSFCDTQDFSAVCVRFEDERKISCGAIPVKGMRFGQYAREAKEPNISDAFVYGNDPSDPSCNFIYQSVPIKRGDETVAVLYGYMSLELLPNMMFTDAYEEEYELYIVDGSTGNYIMDENSGKLGNFFSSGIGNITVRDGYSMETMRNDIRGAVNDGYIVFKNEESDIWYYTYYMPMGINDWCLQMTVSEQHAFSVYDNIRMTMLVLMFCVIILMVFHVLTLMLQNHRTNKKDRENLHKSDYMNSVQRALISAHNNPDFVDRALKIVADEMKAETVLLLSFSDKTVMNAQYWPSKDKTQAMSLVGRNIRDDFPVLFDALCSKNCVIYDKEHKSIDLSESAAMIFNYLDVSNIVLAPVMDNTGSLRGVIAAVNLEDTSRGGEMLECVTYDFFMAITNLENHNIIKSMGSMDYLTGVKNRNSYESEIGGYVTMDCNSLWCVFIDVNGLHEVNNTQGHKAGDIMLCAVADAIKRMFGEKYTYRLGGDEFVAFVPDSTHGEFMKKKKAVIAELAAKGYYVSVGFGSIEKDKNDIFDIEKVVSEAETKMYHDKREFYERNEYTRK